MSSIPFSVQVLVRRNPDVALAIGLLIDVEPEDAFTLLNNLLKGGAINHKQTSVSPGSGFGGFSTYRS